MGTWIDNYLERNLDVSSKPVVIRSQRATHFQLTADLARAVITGGPQYFRDSGNWEPLDPRLKLDQSGKHGAPGLSARVDPQGLVAINDFNYSQQTLSVGTLSQGRYSKLADLGSGRSDGTRLIREVGTYRHEVMLTEQGVKEQLIILEKPANLAGDYLVFETRLPVGFLDEGEASNELITRMGLRFSPGRAFDVSGNIFPMQCFVFNAEGGQRIYSGLPLAILEQASFPLVLDPTVIIDSEGSDGDIWGGDANYATARSTSVDFNTSMDKMYCGQSYETATSQFYVERNFIKFDLSSIHGSIVSATLGLVCVVDESNLAEFDVEIVKQNWEGQDPLSAGNRETAYDNCLAGSLDAVWRNSSGISTGVMVHSPPLDVSYLTPGGLAYYSLRSSRDKNNNAPPSAGREWLLLGSANHANSAYRPILTVDYSAVFPAAARFVVPAASIGIRDTRTKLRARARNISLSTELRRESGK